MFDEDDVRECPECGREVLRQEMSYTFDYYGLPFRLVCNRCWDLLMDNGFDGEFYDASELDEF